MDTKKKEEMEDTFQLYELKEVNGKCHSALRVPRTLPSSYGPEAALPTSDIYNILMADISGSMYCYWPEIVTGWQKSIKDKLSGRTDIYAFGDLIKLKRAGTDLTQEDFTSDGTNDLTGALRIVREQVNQCQESNVRVFIIADGAHDHGEPYPESEICQMVPPPGKTVSVYMLGVGPGFPVQNSIDIRSNMHNGNANVPYLYWAQDTEDIVDQLAAIGEELNSSLVKLKLNVEGYLVPGLDKSSTLHLGEWLYFEQPPQELPPISLSVNDNDPMDISLESKPVSIRQLLTDVFRQWNSLLIQQHRKKNPVPHETFDLMESLFTYCLDLVKQDMPKGKDIKSRLGRKHVKAYELEFRTLLNQSKTLINIEEEYQDELELAEAILKTTVTNRKYDTKNLKLRGHSQDDFEEDLKSFQKLYEKAKPGIMALPPPSPEECCRVTITSTLVDLQDPELHLMFKENKFDFLKAFTMSGIPIYAPVRDASQINPWTIVIKHILVTPFTILSQLVLEESANANSNSLGEDKDVILQQDNEKTRFNAIIPIVPANAADVLKPLVLSNIYAMMATFCIMKNPHVVDYNAHLAALGCAWIRTIREFPVKNRPEFARDRLASIVVTANIYMDRPSVQHYLDAMINNPKQALMTESTDDFNGKTLKCESLVKPTFFMYLKKSKFSMQQVTSISRLLLFEFIGRCLSNYKVDDAEATPFTDFFCLELADPEKKKAWLEKHCKTVIDAFQTSHVDLVEEFFTLDDLLSCLKKFVTGQIAALSDNLLKDLSIALIMEKVKKLKNFGGCGDIMWSSFHHFAQEMDIPEETIDDIFSPSQVSVYVSEALQVKSSRERLSKDLPQADSALDVVKKKITQENACTLRRAILKEVEELVVKQWREAYLRLHSPLVMPMTPQQVIETAQARGIQVAPDTFRQVYRYNDRVGLLRNACQIPDCPHYLQPHNNFNQHISVEREEEEFPHALHLISLDFCSQGVNGVVDEVVSGKHSGTRQRKQPTPPKPTSLQPLTDQLGKLLKIYIERGNQSSAQNVHPPPQNKADDDDEDQDEFYDCKS